MIHDINIKKFLNLLTNDNLILPGVRELKKSNLSILYLVTIPRVRPHKYLKLTKAEALIFFYIFFSIMNDIVISLNKNLNDEDISMLLLQTHALNCKI